jgi:hypothetical protein
MAVRHEFPYRFNTFDVGVFIEIYLPKKMRYQGVLYESLRTGFDFKKVKEHLTEPDKFVRISEFLEDDEGLYKLYDSGDRGKIEERVEDMEEAFCGYSIYEVDGVFFNKMSFEQAKAENKDETTTITVNPFVVEERTQVIRLMFSPNIEDMLKTLKLDKYNDFKKFSRMRRFAERCLVSQIEAEEEIEKLEKRIEEGGITDMDEIKLIGDKSYIFKYTKKWIEDVDLFICGYLLYSICQEIGELYKGGERSEDEIWVTSFWNCNINKITKR